MKRRDAFSACHPAVNLVYFGLVLGFSMVLMHPACLTVSLGAAMACAAVLEGQGAPKRSLRFLPVAVLAAVVNTAFNHEGATILAYFPTGNPLTLESLLYGLAAAVMLWAALIWFSCCSAVMTTDKLVYLFGRVLPSLGLVISMALHFVPRLAEKFRQIREAQRCLGQDLTEGKLLQRLKKAVTLLSILLTWSLENAIETAYSMKGRGYGLPGRTAYSIYRFDRRDGAVLFWLLFWGGSLLAACFHGELKWHYYPTTTGKGSILAVGGYLALCLTPVILHAKEERMWKLLHSRM